MYLDNYKKELGTLSFPPDGAQDQPYPFYDRWGDSFNVTTEFVIVDQARGLANLAFLMAQTSLKNQPWKADTTLRIVDLPARAQVGHPFTVHARDTALDLGKAQLVWEAPETDPTIGGSFTVVPKAAGECWLELEAQLPDGRRAFALTNCVVRP